MLTVDTPTKLLCIYDNFRLDIYHVYTLGKKYIGGIYGFCLFCNYVCLSVCKKKSVKDFSATKTFDLY